MRANVRDGRFSELHFVKLMFKRLKEANVPLDGVDDWGKVEPAVAPAHRSVKAGLQPCATRSRTHESTWSTPRRWSESWCCRMMASYE